MKKLPVYLFTLFFCLALSLFGQSEGPDYFSQHYLFQERLVKGLVFDILQDQQGFMWFGTEYGLVRYDGTHLKKYHHLPGDTTSLAGNVVTCLAEDSKGNLWVGTMNSGLHYFDRRADRFYRYQYNTLDSRSIANNKINDVLVSENGVVWVATEGGGLGRFDETSGGFERFTIPDINSLNTYALLEEDNQQVWFGDFFGLNQWQPEKKAFAAKANIQDIDSSGAVLKALANGTDGLIWAGFHHGGLNQFTTTDSLFKPIFPFGKWEGDPDNSHIWAIFVDGAKSLWVATDGGLFYLQENSQRPGYSVSEYTLSEERRYLSLCKSSDGTMWLGTNDGVVVLIPKHKQFQLILPLNPGELPSSKRGVTSMADGEGEQFWLGTIRGLFQCDINGPRPHQGFLSEHPRLKRFASTNIPSICQDKKGNLWIAAIEGFNDKFSVHHYDVSAKQLMDLTNRHLALSSFTTFSIEEDEQGSIWLGNNNGLFHYFPKRDSLHYFKLQSGLKSNKINQILADGNGQVWIGTNAAGLVKYDLVNGTFEDFPEYFNIPANAGQRRVLSMRLQKDKLWLGTVGGLILFDLKENKFQSYDSRNGLADNVIKSFCTDQRGRFWVGSQSSMAQFDSEKGTFINYNANDGVDMEEFWDRASYQDSNGRLYFGGDDGLLTFHPDSIRSNPFLPPVVFTQFSLFNQEVLPDPNKKLLPEPIEFAKAITLQPRQNVFTIHFSALGFINPRKNAYAIKMEGFEKEWQEIGNRTEATYTNLNPGTYYFKVRTSNNDGIWSEKEAVLKLVVLPPWYRTWWAYLSYLVILASGIFFLYQFQLNRRLAEVETERLRELDAVKTQLYTNITHEFRTPLTLIQGPVDRALKEPSFKLGQKELQHIRQNCRRLLQLIQQVLHLNKLEAGVLQPDYQYGNIIPVLEYLIDAFHSFALSQGIKLEFKAEDTMMEMDFDQEKLAEVLSNLLANAIKFTPVNGRVSMLVNQTEMQKSPYLQIAVRDTGIGISPSDLERIFERFYQTNQPMPDQREESLRSGSGIGLALSKRLVAVMGGELKVQSTLGEGSTFSVLLPVRHTQKGKRKSSYMPDIYTPAYALPTRKNNLENITLDPDLPTVLIVEDNSDVAHFIEECLPAHFQKLVAHDGQKGLAFATKYIPDLIISDVLMPKKDGFTMADQLKKDPCTSHIPVIFLTAKADSDSRLTGLEKGADAYMSKPFSREELNIRVENLLESRRRLQTFYLKQMGAIQQDSEMPTNPAEHQFLRTTRQKIEAHIDRESYSIESLAEDLGISTSQLYRKIKALTGQSTSKFFRQVQIGRAKKMIRETDLNISEIGFKTGFNDPAYFTRVFKAETGESPSAYRDQAHPEA